MWGNFLRDMLDADTALIAVVSDNCKSHASVPPPQQQRFSEPAILLRHTKAERRWGESRSCNSLPLLSLSASSSSSSSRTRSRSSSALRRESSSLLLQSSSSRKNYGGHTNNKRPASEGLSRASSVESGMLRLQQNATKPQRRPSLGDQWFVLEETSSSTQQNYVAPPSTTLTTTRSRRDNRTSSSSNAVFQNLAACTRNTALNDLVTTTVRRGNNNSVFAF